MHAHGAASAVSRRYSSTAPFAPQITAHSVMCFRVAALFRFQIKIAEILFAMEYAAGTRMGFAQRKFLPAAAFSAAEEKRPSRAERLKFF